MAKTVPLRFFEANFYIKGRASNATRPNFDKYSCLKKQAGSFEDFKAQLKGFKAFEKYL